MSEPRQLSLFDGGLFDESPTEFVRRAEVEAPAPREVRLDPAAAMRERLEALMNERFEDFVLTDNRRRMVSLHPSRRGRGRVLRIHRCFLEASESTLSAVAIFFVARRKRERADALAIIRRHFDVAAAQAAPVRSATLHPRGDVYDLEQIRDDVDRRFFDGEVDVDITWGRRPRRRRRARTVSIRLGTYTREENLVRIHRALDREHVPLYVVESVVHHEMLHAVVPPIEEPGRRRRIHPPEFRRRERLFPQYHEAQRWISENLGRLTCAE